MSAIPLQVTSLPDKCSKGLEIGLGLLTHLCMYNLALRTLREEDSEFESLEQSSKILSQNKFFNKGVRDQSLQNFDQKQGQEICDKSGIPNLTLKPI